MGRLVDIQIALKPLKKSDFDFDHLTKITILILTILGLAESFKTMDRPDPTATLFDGLFLGKYERYGHEMLTQSSLKSSVCAIKIWDRNLC